MKPLALTLFVLTLLGGCSGASQSPLTGEQAWRGVRVTLEEPASRHGLPAHISVVYTNTSGQSVDIRLPRPLTDWDDEDGTAAEETLPYLALHMVAPDGKDELPMWALPEAAGPLPAEHAVLTPGQSRRVEYPLSEFHLIGPLGVREDGPITTMVKPGPVALRISGLVFYAKQEDPGTGPRALESNSALVKCGFPKYLFRSKNL